MIQQKQRLPRNDQRFEDFEEFNMNTQDDRQFLDYVNEKVGTESNRIGSENASFRFSDNNNLHPHLRQNFFNLTPLRRNLYSRSSANQQSPINQESSPRVNQQGAFFDDMKDRKEQQQTNQGSGGEKIPQVSIGKQEEQANHDGKMASSFKYNGQKQGRSQFDDHLQSTQNNNVTESEKQRNLGILIENQNSTSIKEHSISSPFKITNYIGPPDSIKKYGKLAHPRESDIKLTISQNIDEISEDKIVLQKEQQITQKQGLYDKLNTIKFYQPQQLQLHTFNITDTILPTSIHNKKANMKLNQLVGGVGGVGGGGGGASSGNTSPYDEKSKLNQGRRTSHYVPEWYGTLKTNQQLKTPLPSNRERGISNLEPEQNLNNNNKMTVTCRGGFARRRVNAKELEYEAISCGNNNSDLTNLNTTNLINPIAQDNQDMEYYRNIEKSQNQYDCQSLFPDSRSIIVIIISNIDDFYAHLAKVQLIQNNTSNLSNLILSTNNNSNSNFHQYKLTSPICLQHLNYLQKSAAFLKRIYIPLQQAYFQHSVQEMGKIKQVLPNFFESIDKIKKTVNQVYSSLNIPENRDNFFNYFHDSSLQLIDGLQNLDEESQILLVSKTNMLDDIKQSSKKFDLKLPVDLNIGIGDNSLALFPSPNQTKITSEREEFYNQNTKFFGQTFNSSGTPNQDFSIFKQRDFLVGISSRESPINNRKSVQIEGTSLFDNIFQRQSLQNSQFFLDCTSPTSSAIINQSDMTNDNKYHLIPRQKFFSQNHDGTQQAFSVELPTNNSALNSSNHISQEEIDKIKYLYSSQNQLQDDIQSHTPRSNNTRRFEYLEPFRAKDTQNQFFPKSARNSSNNEKREQTPLNLTKDQFFRQTQKYSTFLSNQSDVPGSSDYQGSKKNIINQSVILIKKAPTKIQSEKYNFLEEFLVVFKIEKFDVLLPKLSPANSLKLPAEKIKEYFSDFIEILSHEDPPVLNKEFLDEVAPHMKNDDFLDALIDSILLVYSMNLKQFFNQTRNSQESVFQHLIQYLIAGNEPHHKQDYLNWWDFLQFQYYFIDQKWNQIGQVRFITSLCTEDSSQQLVKISRLKFILSEHLQLKNNIISNQIKILLSTRFFVDQESISAMQFQEILTQESIINLRDIIGVIFAFLQ